MKRIKSIFFVCTLCTLFFVPSSCEKSPTEIVEDFELAVDTDFMEYTIMVELIDAADPLTPPENIELTVEGEFENALLDSKGTKDFQIKDGRLVLLLNPAHKPLNEDDVKTFNVSAKAPGYLPVNFPVSFRESEKQQNLTINMVNLNTPPEGVANTQKQFSLVSGTTLTPVKVQVDASASNGKKTGANLQIDPNTSFFDKNGNKLAGGPLNVSLTHFDAEGDASLNSFPGGFTPEGAITPGGEAEDIFFVTAGFASIDMSVNGTEVREFSNPIKVTMEVSPDGYNLDTDTEIKEGDVIPVWSYEVETGIWQYEKDGVVKRNNGKLEVEFTTTHLSWYNLDFFGSTCRRSNTITVNAPQSNSREIFYTELVYSHNNQPVSYYSRKNMYLYDGATINYFYAPRASTKLRVFSGSNYYNKGELIAETSSFNPCSGGTSITIPASAFPPVVNIDMTLTCPDSNFKLRPSYSFYYKETGSRYWRYGYMSSGKISSSQFKVGSTYDFRVYLSGEVLNFTETITQTDNEFIIEIDPEICDRFL